MRTWAIGDVHGCLIALDTLLRELQLKPDDQLIFLGDLIDRGPDSRGVLDRVLGLRQERTVHVIQGNHEEMMLIARDLPGYARAWQQFGGEETIQSYGWTPGSDVSWIEAVPEKHWQFLRSGMVDAVEEAGHIMVHGSLEADRPLSEQPWNELRWKKWDNPRPHQSGQIVVCGHTHQPSGLPLSVQHTICIDTWVYGDGWLTGLALDDQEYVQANERGEYRRGRLAP